MEFIPELDIKNCLDLVRYNTTFNLLLLNYDRFGVSVLIECELYPGICVRIRGYHENSVHRAVLMLLEQLNVARRLL